MYIVRWRAKDMACNDVSYDLILYHTVVHTSIQTKERKEKRRQR
jgi:hypothetical protein